MAAMVVRAFRWLESNLISMVLAILLALTVWIVATQEVNPVEQAEFPSPIPIELEGLGAGLTVTNDPAKTAMVEVRAPRSTMRSLSAEDITITADLSALGPGTHEVPLKVSVSGQAVVVSLRPARIRVDIEETGERELPIQLRLEGQLPVGYRAAAPIVQPSVVRVSGAKSRVALVSEVRAVASLSGLRDTFRGALPLRAYDSDGNLIEDVNITPTTANVTVPISQEEDFREVAVRVNANVLPARGYYVARITAEPPLVPVRGDPDILRNLTAIETQLISLQGLTEDTDIVAQLQPPEGVTLEGIQTVEVHISVQAQPDFRVIEVPIRAIGLADGLEATILPSSAVVSISGPLPVLDRLNEQQDILITVDLSGLRPGRYQRALKVEIVSGEIPAADLQKVVVESVLPTLVEVEIVTAGGR